MFLVLSTNMDDGTLFSCHQKAEMGWLNPKVGQTRLGADLVLQSLHTDPLQWQTLMNPVGVVVQPILGITPFLQEIAVIQPVFSPNAKLLLRK